MNQLNYNRPAVTLKRGREVSIKRQHPWVFSGAIADRHGVLKSGVLLDVRSHSGEHLGSGHWGTKSIAVRMLSFDKVSSEEHLIAERLANAFTYRKRLQLVDNLITNGFRLVNAEGDSLPGLIIDVYDGVAVVQCHSQGMWRLKDTIEKYLLGLQSSFITKVVFRRVDAQLEDEQDGEEDGTPRQEAEQAPSESTTFLENGLRFLVDLTGGQKTGFFLDQRLNRERAKSYCLDRHVLNAFSYTGAFSVYAFAGGAKSVCSVDISKPAIDLCRQNIVSNFTEVQHSFEVADCFKYLEQISDSFDTVILDPPAFAKHQKALNRAMRGYEAINAMALRKVKPGGTLLTFSCSQVVSRELFRDTLLRAAMSVGRPVKIAENFSQAPCHPTSIFHPEGEYLKGFALHVE